MAFDRFSEQSLAVGDGIEIYARVGGRGPPLLLLHGYPQTHVCWHKVVDALAEDFTVVATDLRGYGASSKPSRRQDPTLYTKRAMARDQVQAMQQLGFERFHVVGHDRGGRVAHRMAIDSPEAVDRLAVVDIAPTLTMYTATDQTFAEAYYHWFFLIQPYDFPERLIGGDPEYFLRHTFKSWCKTDGAISSDAFEAYLRAFQNPDMIHASCEDYRAAATLDLDHDREDDAEDAKILAPVLAVWGAKGIVGKKFDVIQSWKEKAAFPVEGFALECGHFIPEEDPQGLINALVPFLKAQKD